MKKSLIMGLSLMALVASQGRAEDQVKLIADFNSAAPNNVGGNFGGFSPDPKEQTYVCLESTDDEIRHGESGSSMRLVYNVGKAGAFNGFWMKFGPDEGENNLDATGFKKLTFWLRGDEKSGIPNKIKIELKGDSASARKYVGEITDKWKKIEIPLQEFASQKLDLAKLNEFVLVFEQKTASPSTQGAIFIDDVALEK